MALVAVVMAPSAPSSLRIYDSALRAAVFGAAERSPTLARLLRRLTEFKAIVVVQWSPGLEPGLEAATLPQVTVTDQTLYVHIIVKPAKVTDHLVSVVAHEVQHSIEILESGRSDSADITAMFRQSGGGLTRRFYCTPAAADAGRAVLEELRRARFRS